MSSLCLFINNHRTLNLRRDLTSISTTAVPTKRPEIPNRHGKSNKFSESKIANFRQKCWKINREKTTVRYFTAATTSSSQTGIKPNTCTFRTAANSPCHRVFKFSTVHHRNRFQQRRREPTANRCRNQSSESLSFLHY